jgi:NAD kinase
LAVSRANPNNSLGYVELRQLSPTCPAEHRGSPIHFDPSSPFHRETKSKIQIEIGIEIDSPNPCSLLTT